jgi:hypothetical protein
MVQSLMRLLTGLALMVTPLIYHRQQIIGDDAARYESSETLLLFGQSISKSVYLGMMSCIALIGLVILLLGLKGFKSSPKT